MNKFETPSQCVTTDAQCSILKAAKDCNGTKLLAKVGDIDFMARKLNTITLVESCISLQQNECVKRVQQSLFQVPLPYCNQHYVQSNLEATK